MSNNFSELVFDSKTTIKSGPVFDHASRSFDIDKKLKQYGKIQDEFVNIASHEIKTPIQSILTYSQLLYSNLNEIHPEYIEAIYRNALRLQRLSKNLLDITKVENHTLILKNERFDINELVSSIIQDFVMHARNSGIKTNIQFLFSPKGRIFVYADKDRITQVMTNLIDNAFKFTQRGNISTSIIKQDDRIIVSVEDSGIGINAHIASRLFSKFATSSENGIGLGLYISKNIVEAHDGKIWAKNNLNRSGATISFQIPIKIHSESVVNHPGVPVKF